LAALPLGLHTGRSRIKLKSTGEVFTINPCNVKANNVIVGSTWVDNEGAYALINTTTGARADMYFTPCGWWGNGRYQVGCHPVLRLSRGDPLRERERAVQSGPGRSLEGART
jgi:hypothetical protein